MPLTRLAINPNEPLDFRGEIEIEERRPQDPPLADVLAQREAMLGVPGLAVVVGECQQTLAGRRSDPQYCDGALGEEEELAVAVYTFDWGPRRPREHNPYFALNAALRFSPSDRRLWSPFVAALLRACNALPKFIGTAYRGHPDADEVRREYTQGRQVYWSAFTSCTEDADVARHFAGPTGVVFKITVLHGAQLGPHSCLVAEREVLLRPSAGFVVAQATHTGSDGQLWADLVQLDPATRLLQS